MFNLLEITSAYYHPPEAKTVKAWLAETPGAEPFYFAVRLWNKLVRERALLLQNDIRLMKAALTPLQEERKLGAVLVPVLPGMRYSESNELWLLALLDTFAEFPLFVENLHPSWSNSDTLLRLQDRGVGVAELDRAEAARPEVLPRTSPQRAAYLRCNGRTSNPAASQSAAPETYLYSEAEIAGLARKIKNSLPVLASCFAVFHNHLRGHALANAVQLRHALTGARIDAPQSLSQAFPVLQKPAAAAKQRDLFEESI
jgi:uncharacterized protein YecE (DUF72 family)